MSQSSGWGSPWLSGDPWLTQLRVVLELQRQAGRQLFLIAATTETEDELAAVIEAIAADQVTTVLLSAPADTIAARVDAREPDIWPGKDRLIKHARDLAVSMQTLAAIDIRIDTQSRQAVDVAVELRNRLRARDLAV